MRAVGTRRKKSPLQMAIVNYLIHSSASKLLVIFIDQATMKRLT